MAEYYENRIVLSAEESTAFRQKMDHPSADAAQNRDRNLDWIAEHMDIQITATGFVVTVSDDDKTAADVVTTTDSYQIGDRTEPVRLVGVIQSHTAVTKKVVLWGKLRGLNYGY